jgi:hypothetical protein
MDLWLFMHRQWFRSRLERIPLKLQTQSGLCTLHGNLAMRIICLGKDFEMSTESLSYTEVTIQSDALLFFLPMLKIVEILLACSHECKLW